MNEKGTTETGHVLVVDDDLSIRRMFQQLLTTNGYRVSVAASGEEALFFLDLVTPDLILLDLNLPGLDGLETTKKIKSDPSKPFIPIMLVTARDEQKLKVRGLDAGADEYLVKPVDLMELLARVRALLRLQRSQRSLRAEQRKTEVLLQLTSALGKTLDIDQLLYHFLDYLADAVGAMRASIILNIGDQPRLFSSDQSRPLIPLPDILREGAAGWAVRSREPVIIAETRDDPRWIGNTPHHRLIRSAAVMPIVRDDQALGAITLVHHTPGYFTDYHIDLLRSVAAQCAFALDNAQLFQLTRKQKDLLERRAEELQRINEVSRFMAELMRPEQLIRLVVHLIYSTFGYPKIQMLMREAKDLVVRAASGENIETLGMGMRHSATEGFAGWVLEHCESLCITDAPSDVRYMWSEDDAVRSILAVPVMTSRDVFGVLKVTSNTPQAFDQDDVRLLETLSSQLGVALKNAQLFDTEQRRVRQLERVNHLSIAITAQLDVNANLHLGAEAMTTIFGVDTCGIAVTGYGFHEQPYLAFYTNHAIAPDSPLSFQLPLRQLADIELDDSRTFDVATSDKRLDQVRDILLRHHIDRLVLTPLISAGRHIGVIAMDISTLQDAFGYGDMTLLETVARLLSQVLENARLYREVEDERSTLNAVLRGAADPILLIDPRDQLILANRAADQRLALGNRIGETIANLHLEPDLQQALRNSNGALNHNLSNAAQEVTMSNGDSFSVSVAPVYSAESSLIGRVAVIQDITAIKKLERQEQERLRAVFRRYVSPQVVEEILVGGGDFGEPAEREVVVLFTDIRGYTTLTEGLPPRVLVEQVLNRYLTAMTEAMYEFGGTIDKFMGDGVIGVFGVPIARHDDIPRSLKAAMAMQQSFEQLRIRWREELNLDIGMGIGIGYGPAVVGNVGSDQRVDYTVIGDVVNTTSRLNGLAKAGEIIVSHHVIDRLPEDFDRSFLEELGPVSLRGKQEPHLIYRLLYT